MFIEIGNHSDSTLIIGDTFQFTGTLDNDVQEALIHTQDNSDYKNLWLEKSAMTFNSKKGDFHSAEIRGSKTQVLEDELNAVIDPLNKKLSDANKTTTLSANERAEIFEKIRAKESSINIHFIETHPESIISVNMLAIYASTWGKSQSKRLYELLTPELKNGKDGKSVLKFIILNKDIQIGKPLVDFTQYDVDGKPVKLSDFKGNIILLDFWASWCGPCRQENPKLISIYNTYKVNGFKIIAVSVDDSKPDWLAAIKKDHLPYINLSEKNGGENTADIIYGVNKYPSNYLIDKNGIIIAQDVHGKELGNTLMKFYPRTITK